jgi:hypothetical protein
MLDRYPTQKLLRRARALEILLGEEEEASRMTPTGRP